MSAIGKFNSVVGFVRNLKFLLVEVGLAGAIGTAIASILAFVFALPWPFAVAFGVFVGFLVLGIVIIVVERLAPLLLSRGNTVGSGPIPPAEARPSAATVDLGASYFRNVTVPIRELADINVLVHDRVFEDCDIVGPVVLYVVGNVTISESGFMVPSIDDLVYDIVGPREIPGVIGVERCTFRRCRFDRVGFVVDADRRRMMTEATAWTHQPTTPQSQDRPPVGNES